MNEDLFPIGKGKHFKLAIFVYWSIDFLFANNKALSKLSIKVVHPIIYNALHIPGGCLGFLLSTVGIYEVLIFHSHYFPWEWRIYLSFTIKIHHSCRYTPRKINMEPENHLFEKEIYLPYHHFQVLWSSMLIFWGVPPFLWCHFSVFPHAIFHSGRLVAQGDLALPGSGECWKGGSTWPGGGGGEKRGKWGPFVWQEISRFVDF